MIVPTVAREEMDSSAMLRRAAERGEQLETYDPDKLVADVRALLYAHGLDPQLPPGTGRAGMASGAAGMLLRAFGILPAADQGLYFDRTNDATA
ncbi:MAG: hypothetical protein V7603_5012 [Micromonosporaceae bacterium]